MYFWGAQMFKYLDLLLCAQSAHGSEWVNETETCLIDRGRSLRRPLLFSLLQVLFHMLTIPLHLSHKLSHE